MDKLNSLIDWIDEDEGYGNTFDDNSIHNEGNNSGNDDFDEGDDDDDEGNDDDDGYCIGHPWSETQCW